MREATFNGLGTIQPDFETPWSDKVRKYSKEHPVSSERMQEYKARYRGKSTFGINPKWRLCFAGR